MLVEWKVTENRREDGVQVGGRWVHLLLFTIRIFGWSSEKLIIQQNLSGLEAKEYRRHFSTGGLRRFYRLKGKYPGHGTCSSGDAGQRLQLRGSLPPSRAGNSQTWARSDLDTQSCRDPAYTHTQWAAHPQLQRQRPTRRVPETGILRAPVPGGDRLQPVLTVRDFWLFGEVVCAESQTVTQCCSGNGWRDFLKREAKVYRAGNPCASKGKRLRVWFAPNDCSWAEKGAQWGDFEAPARQSNRMEAAQSGEFRTESVTRAVG